MNVRLVHVVTVAHVSMVLVSTYAFVKAIILEPTVNGVSVNVVLR